MALPRRLARRLRSARIWIALGVLAPVEMLIVPGLMLLDLRRDAWAMSEQTSKNLLQVIERDIARNVEIINLTLQAVVDNLKAPGVADATPELRQFILFDRASTARDLGVTSQPTRNCSLIPILTDQNPRAQARSPIDRMRQGRSTRVFQAWQQWSRMSA